MSISEIRIRNPGEVIPISAEISNISWHDWTADKAIDLDFDTFSVAIAGSDGKIWTKLKLEKLYCVKQVITYIMDGQYWFIANCSQNSCTSNRDNHQAVISSSTEDTTLPLKTGCIFGDTVQVNTQETGKLYEIAVMVLDDSMTLTIVVGGGAALATVIAVCVVTTVLIRKRVPQVRGKQFKLAWFF